MGERQRAHHYIGTISLNGLQFRSSERAFFNQIKLLRRKIAKQWKARQQQIDDLNKEMHSATIGSEETDRRHPSNQYDGGRLTLRGEEICYRLFDQGLSNMAVAYLMGLQLASVRNRQRSWVKVGGTQRPVVEFETLPERKYCRRYDD